MNSPFTAMPSVVSSMCHFFHALNAIKKRGHARKWNSSMLMSTMVVCIEKHRALSKGCMLCKSKIFFFGCVPNIEPMYLRIKDGDAT